MKPHNILLILVDDLHWSNVGAYGSDFFETPSLDRLAREGWRFTDGYSAAPICSASRAGILTGCSPARLGFEFVSKPPDAEGPHHTKLRQPPHVAELASGLPTLGDAMRRAGYVTGHIGKWHLTQQHDRYLGYGKVNGPAQRGFDVVEEDRGAHPCNYAERGLGNYAEGEFPPDASSQAAVRFIHDHKGKPFFLKFASYFPHVPVHSPCGWLLDKYRKKSGGKADEKRVAFGAFIETMDHYIGHVLDALDEAGLTENTLVWFVSDHGGEPPHAPGPPLRGSKWTLYEGGIRTPVLMRWPAHLAAGRVESTPVGGLDIMPTLCALTGQAAPEGQDGCDLSPLLLNQEPGVRAAPLFWHFPFYHPTKGCYEGTTPCSALRREHWKLIHFHEDQRSELYDLEQDIGETRDLARVRPDLLVELEDELFTLLNERGARFPEPNPAYLDF